MDSAAFQAGARAFGSLGESHQLAGIRDTPVWHNIQPQAAATALERQWRHCGERSSANANIRFHDPQGQLPKEMVSAQLELDIASTQQPAGQWKARPESTGLPYTG